MRLIIDIPDTQYNNIMEVKSMSLGRIPYKGIIMNAIKGIQNGTPIPDNATNGDMIKAMFPNSKYTEYFADVEMRTVESDTRFKSVFDRDWWDEPYQKGGK